MTLIAAVKYGKKGCIVSDFRLTDTTTGNQFDVAQKFTFIGNKIALFMAGSVFYLADIKNKLDSRVSEITSENFDDNKGPFVQEIESVFNLKQSGSSSIIGVFLDDSEKDFKMLRFDAICNNGRWQYNLVPDSQFSWQVIGSGEIISDPTFYPARKPFSLQDTFKSGQDRGYDLYTAGNLVENEIEARLKILGKDVYKKLGISPVMNLTLIAESGLQVVGRTMEGESYGNEVNHQWSYSYERQPNGLVELKDEKTGEIVTVHQTLKNQFPSSAIRTAVQFDPAKLEGIYSQYPKYTLSQWDVTLPGDNTKLERYIHETVYKEWSGSGYYFPVRSIVYAEVRNFEQTLTLQTNINDYKIISDLLGDFQTVELFDEEWLNNNLGQNHPFRIITN